MVKDGAGDSFDILLDELNAFTADLAIAIDLRKFRDPDLDDTYRENFVSLMTFVAKYLDHARNHQDKWNTRQKVLHDSVPTKNGRVKMKDIVATLWLRAEHVLKRACSTPDSGLDYSPTTTKYLKTFCEKSQR